MDYEEAVDYIINIPRFSNETTSRGKTGNKNLSVLLERLGNPHMRQPAIHIAGTNGKGSVTEFTGEILRELGYSVGIFTSPHLVRINERIAIKAKSSDTETYISDSQFVSIFNLIKKEVDQMVALGYPHISFFEFMFAIAAVYFDRKKPDFVIFETGLGGRLDATNLAAPLICGITSIGLDHMRYLGDTIEKISAEKAGIIKKGVPVVYNTGDAIADRVIEKEAELLGSEAINVAKTNYIINELSDKAIAFSCFNRYYKYDNLRIPVNGALYQVDNALTAITICSRLFKRAIPETALNNALSHFKWRGRMEKINEHVILDGAHNPDAIDRFIESVDKAYGDEDKLLLFAVAGDKDYTQMIRMLCERLTFKKIYVTSLCSDRRISADYIADIFKKYAATDCSVYAGDSIASTYRLAYDNAVKENSYLFCVGSLYLIGSIYELGN